VQTFGEAFNNMLRILGALFLVLLAAACLRLFKKGQLKSSLYDALGLTIFAITVLLDFESLFAKFLAFAGATLLAIGFSLAITKDSGMLKELKSANSLLLLLWPRIPPNLNECRPATTRRDALLTAALCFLTALVIVFIPGGYHLGAIYFLAAIGVLTGIQSFFYLRQ